MIDLLLLGTSGMMPLPNRWLSSLLARSEGNLVLFDCGEGTQIPMQTFGWGFRRLGTICLSHMHADHVAGLPGLFHAVANAGRTEPLIIHGPEGTEETIFALRHLAPVLPFEVTVVEVGSQGSTDLPGSMSGSTFPGDHRLPCICYRIDLPRRPRFLAERAQELGIPISFWSRLQDGEDVSIDGRVIERDALLGPARKGLSIGFVTDTRPSNELADFLQGVDLLVCEGTYGDSADQQKAIERKHMTFAESAQLALQAGAGALWLTHFSPAVSNPQDYLENATSIFPNTTIGFSGLSVTLTFPDDSETTGSHAERGLPS